MSHLWRVAWTIARRDYVAAVFSRIFVLFLLLPVILVGLGLAFGAIGAHGNAGGGAPTQDIVSVRDGDLSALAAARSRLAGRLGDDALPDLVANADRHAAVLSGTLAAPRLALPADAPDDLADRVGLIVDEARSARALGGAPPAPVHVIIERSRVARHGGDAEVGRVALAQGAQYAMLILTVMLAGRLLSSFIEERSNKVIEVLAAAVPVDAIFIGKLIGMLLFSLTCVAGWGVTLLAGTAAFAPALLHGLASPAIGWAAFVPLTLLYFAATYLLLGAVLLGLGAQASSPSDVQTLALPTTLAQLGVFALASIDIGRPDHWIALAAAIFPWSSPLAMAARAAERPALWPHLLAILWQAAWLWLVVRLAAGRFRRAVLKSGPVRRQAQARDDAKRA